MLADSQTSWLNANASRGKLLAQHVSIASLVDPGLLRAARIALALPIAVELELRCSPIVSSSGPAGLVLADEVLPELRGGLDAAARELAWRLTRARHGSISPALELEETLTWQSLEHGDSSLPDAEAQLNRALVTIVRGQKTQLAAWAARALPRLPENVRELSSARLLASAVEANGYKNSPSVASYGAPPAWMVPSRSKGGFQGSVALNGTTLEINCPPRSGYATIPIPGDYRIWVGWWKDGKRIWSQATVPKTRPLFVEVDGAEIWIEAPELGRIVLRDQTAPRVQVVDLGTGEYGTRKQLADFLRERLPALGFNVLPFGVTPSFPGPAADFLLVIYEAGKASEFISSFLSTDKWGCRPIVLLTTEEPQEYPNSYEDTEEELPQSYPTPSAEMPSSAVSEYNPPPPLYDRVDQLSHLAVATIDCSDPTDWDNVVEQIGGLIMAGPPALASLTGVPDLPSVFLRRTQLFEELRLLLLGGADGIVNLYGERGNGRTMAAVDLLNDCSMRRRYNAGIRWLWDGDSYPNDLQHPSLIVFDESQLSDFSAIQDNAYTMMENGSCYLVLTTTPFSAVNYPIHVLESGEWTVEERRELFRKASGGAEQHGLGDVGPSEPSRAFILTLPVRSVVNLGVLFGAAVRSGKLKPEVRDIFPSTPGLADVLFELDVVRPFAACPADWMMLSPRQNVWSRYFGTSDFGHIELACQLIGRLFPGREIPIEVSEPLAELARPTHQRIVDSYRDECGGDWAVCPDDGYFLEFFGHHLWHAEPNRIEELTENIDWLMRVARDAPDWHYCLPASLKEKKPRWLAAPPSLESFARGNMYDAKPRYALSREAVAASIGRRSWSMAAGRIALRDRSPVRWIMVVGTGRYELEAAELGVARTVGRELARWGFGLITGGWQGVDYVTAEAYVQQLATNDIPADVGLLQVIEERRQPAFQQGLIVAAVEAGWMVDCVARADAVVAIGGAGATLQVCRVASRSGKVVVPIPGAGGDAQAFYEEITESARLQIASVAQPLQSGSQYYEVARALLELLLSRVALPEKGGYEPAA